MKTGDRVVCVRTHISAIFGTLIVQKNKIYTIEAIVTCSCGCFGLSTGLPNPAGTMRCATCQGRVNYPDFISHSDKFRPIEYNSATEELANKEIVEEKLDVPVKEPQKATS